MDFNSLEKSLNEAWHSILSLSVCILGKTNESQSFLQCYSSHDSLATGLVLCGVLIAYSFIWSIIGQNCSKVDQIWSIAPVLYCWHFYAHSILSNQQSHSRLLLLCLLVTIWGVRLTFNFWRKGGYGTFFVHEEDYRWPILRAKMHPIVFQLFNLTFIATYQNLLLFWIAAPAYVVSTTSPDLGIYDLIVGIIFSLLLIMETIADEQHWAFQSIKHSLTAAQRTAHPNEEFRQGFYQSGLFQYSRHPNYFAEQCMWVCIYLFSLSSAVYALPVGTASTATELLLPFLNWSGLGCLQLILLFQGSMAFGESITLSKYPDYAAYQRSTSQCFPMPADRRNRTKAD